MRWAPGRKKLLHQILERLKEKYRGATQIMLQTNGDLPNGEISDTLVLKGVTRIDLASIDRYHIHAGARLDILGRSFIPEASVTKIQTHSLKRIPILSMTGSVSGTGAPTNKCGLGGNWARGRALNKNIRRKYPQPNFCHILSGAGGFLGGTELPKEISILLWKMGEARGLSPEQPLQETACLENICLFCDSFCCPVPESPNLHSFVRKITWLRSSPDLGQPGKSS